MKGLEWAKLSKAKITSLRNHKSFSSVLGDSIVIGNYGLRKCGT